MLGAAIAFCVCKIRKIKDDKSIIRITVFFAYLFGLLSITVFPRIDVGILSDSGKFFVDFRFNSLSKSSFNAIPFQSIIYYLKELFLGDKDSRMVARLNVLGNVILFIPMGLILGMIIHKKKIGLMALITVITSLSIEIIQFFIGRSFDIDDIILNVVGAIIGYLVCSLINQIKKREHKTT